MVGRPDPDGNVYTIESLNGDGSTMNKTRRDLLYISQYIGQQMDLEKPQEISESTTSATCIEDSSSGSSGSVLRVVEIVPRGSKDPHRETDKTGMFNDCLQKETTDEEKQLPVDEFSSDTSHEESPPISCVEPRHEQGPLLTADYSSSGKEAVKPRRTSRKTAGKHFDPLNLPKSVLSP